MLSVLKNALVTGASKEDVAIRKKELDWFARNCWIITSQSTVIAGFSFSQLSKAPDSPSSSFAAVLHLALTGASFAAALTVLVRATLTGIYAQGLALRGPAGFSDMAAAVDRLRAAQDRILQVFAAALVCFVFSSFTVVLANEKQKKTSLKLQTALAVAAIAMALVAWRSLRLFYHKRCLGAAGGGLRGIEGIYGRLGDLDALVTAE
ncbi:high mobility group protein, putative [Eimeria tenella]|uniref:High mobility group protein, putative n=1 Tax=Eimeria tenella TaxID=5802 RepID=U6L596_EIMTE|nr:high mobility group protein, putative [Eimeria tenella]CDJ42920.1 high mobility group protein, putative [Eimeria tenella]|eukprot:XP_013233670.1 high mobility group protein, putative [Eimeria tenella]